MGREAYRMGVKFVNPMIIKTKLLELLMQLGAHDTGKGEFGNVEMEFAFPEGYLEIMISNPKENKELLNRAFKSRGIEIESSENKPNITTMEMRFAKVNSPDLVDRIIGIMKSLQDMGIVSKVGDLEVREEINIDNFNSFKERVKKAKEEFENWHHPIPNPVRCSEVYKTLQAMYPDEYKTASSIDKISQ